MKSFAFVLCLVVVAVSADLVQERWDTVHQKCQQSPTTQVPDIIFEQLKRGEDPTLPPNFGLHANCMLRKLDLQDDQGNIIRDGIKLAAQRHFTDSAKVDEIVNECSTTKETKEKTALNLFRCLRKHRINIGQL